MYTNKRILVVDDNEDYCEGVVDFLETEGYKAVGVHDGFNALEAIKEEEFDMVLMDVRMPGMDGVETFQKLKYVSPETPAILMTAFAMEDRIREALRNGVFGAFQKPVDNERLICSIEKSFLGGAVVMITGGDKELCSNTLDTLVEDGYRGVIVINGENVVRMAKEKKFDFIIMDIEPLITDNLEVCMTIRDFRPDVAIFVVTDDKEGVEKLADQALRDNAYACLEKPLDTDHLLECMRKVLEGHGE